MHTHTHTHTHTYTVRVYWQTTFPAQAPPERLKMKACLINDVEVFCHN